MTTELLPGEFVIWTRRTTSLFGLSADTDTRCFVRYLGIFAGQAVIEDADGTRGFTTTDKLTSADKPLIEPPIGESPAT